MGVEFAAERRLLSEGEYEPVVRSHYPSVGRLSRAELVDLAGWLRGQRDRARDISRQQVRLRRGKADGAAPERASERGLASKKQVFARALKRVNARLEQFRAAEKRERALAAMQAALARRGSAEPHHPSAGMTPGHGLRARESGRRRTNVPPGRIGSVSQAGRNAQAGRDARG
jgi:hypothetical protein